MKKQSRRWSTVTKEDIEAYLASCSFDGKNPNTIILYISAIRGIFNYIEKTTGLMNPAKYIQSPKAKKSVPNVVSMDIISKAILNEPKNDIKLAIALMAYAGLRVSEVRAIQVQDIDVYDNRVLIHGKGMKDRYIYLTEGMISLMIRNHTKGLIFNMQDREFRYEIWRAFDRIGVQCSPHVLRHSFASFAIDSGMRIDILREVLGHTSVATTQIYLHSANSVVKESMNKIQKLAM